MPTSKITAIVFTVLFAFLGRTSAAEHGEHEAAPEAKGGEHGEKPAEGGAEGGEGKSSKTPWIEIENKIVELSSKVKSKESNITKLLEEKDHLPANSPEIKTLLNSIVKEHAEMRTLAEEYQRNLSILKYRFPERNAKAERKYERIEVKSIEEMEQAVGVDGKLNRNLKRMRAQFPPPAPLATTAKPVEKTEAESKKDDKKKEKSIEDAGAVVITH